MVVFFQDGFVSETEVGTTKWNYDKISFITESDRYLVFAFSQNHAQIYDKQSLVGGSFQEFSEFIQTVTGKTIQQI